MSDINKDALIEVTKTLVNILYEVIPGTTGIEDSIDILSDKLSFLQEKWAAQKLYSMFIDFIAEYNQADYDVWCCDFDQTGDWPKYVSKYPDRKPMIIAIQKSKLYLSAKTIKGAEELLEEMTGTYEYIWEEVNKFDTHNSCKSYRYWLYTLWLNDRGINAEYTEEVERDKNWYEFLKDLHDGYWYRRLDKLFERYINKDII